MDQFLFHLTGIWRTRNAIRFGVDGAVINDAPMVSFMERCTCIVPLAVVKLLMVLAQ